jgi:hypothetical protein
MVSAKMLLYFYKNTRRYISVDRNRDIKGRVTVKFGKKGNFFYRLLISEKHSLIILTLQKSVIF